MELALIKLCYLKQSLQLTSEIAGVSKKKWVDEVRAVPFRNIQPIEVKQSGAKLMVETAPVSKPIQPATTPLPTTNTIKQATTAPPTTISALDKIRRQYQTNGSGHQANANEPLTIEKLQEAWNGYVKLLREGKNPAAQPFELAVLRIKDANSFEVVTTNNIEHKFIEQERNRLFQYLLQHLQNRSLQFNVTIEETLREKPVIEVSLTAKEQFQKMSEQYPMVKELKERLRLDLDY